MLTIQKTQDYNLFTRIMGNRTHNKAQISKLAESFNSNPELIEATPIIVNDKLEIIDGQHRLEAVKRLGLNVYYFVVKGLGLEDVQKLNSSTKTWTPTDYARSFAERGNKHYQKYLDYKNKYHLTHEIVVSYLAQDKGATPNIFRSGKFKVENLDLADVLCSNLIEIQEYHKRGDTKKFAFAFKNMVMHPRYDHKKMIAKAKLFGSKYFQDAATTQDYMRQLEKIYNHHNKVKDEEIKIF